MNKSIFWLLKIQLINQFRLNDLKKGSSAAKTKKNTIGMAFAFAILIIVFGSYSYGLAYGFGYLGLSNLVPAYAVTVTGIVTVIFTMLKTNGILFGYRDYDLLMSLPMPTSTVIASRFLYMYVMNMLFTAVIMLPMGAGYVFWVRPSVLFYLYWIIGMLASPLIPTAAATIVGALIMAAASRFKYAKAVSTLLSFALIIGVLALSMSGGFVESSITVTNIKDLGTLIYNQICSIYPPAALFSQSLGKNGFLYFLLYLASSVFLYLLFVKLLSLRYKAINTGIKGQITRSNYKMTTLKTASPLQALYKKELKRFFSSSIYLLNIGTGILMALIFVIAFAVMGPEKLEVTLGMPGFSNVVLKIVPFITSIMIAMSCSTCSSLSLEGKNLWILQSAPVSSKTVFDSKILVNLTLVLPVALISGVLLSIRLRPDLVSAILLFAVPLTYGFFTAVWGMFINIKMPDFDWETEVTVVKQNFSSMLGMLGSAIFALAAIGVLFIPFGIDYRIVSFLILLIIWVMIGALYRFVCRAKIGIQ